MYITSDSENCGFALSLKDSITTQFPGLSQYHRDYQSESLFALCISRFTCPHIKASTSYVCHLFN